MRIIQCPFNDQERKDQGIGKDKEDIEFKKVENIAVAVIPEEQSEEQEWKVYLLNLRDKPITNVLVNSRGYGKKEGHEVKTSVLRHFFEKIAPQEYVLVELIHGELLHLSNEFWISFRSDGYMYDKKVIFVTESIQKDNMTVVPLLQKKGVMIK